MAEPETKFTFDTELSADSVEWCPVENYRHFFALGTYQVDKNEESQTFSDKQRHGRLYLFEDSSFQVLHVQDTEAILDMKWCSSRSNPPSLAVTTSSGNLLEFHLQNSKLVLQKTTSLKESKDQALVVLSLDWNDRRQAQNELKLVTSDSLGFVTLINAQSGCGHEIQKRWKCHDFEAWISVFDAWNSNIIYSGGDDCQLRQSDVREAENGQRTFGRIHNAGVTSLLSDIHHQHQLYSGSYDEHLRLWDTRKCKQPVTEYQTAGGGIWRIRQNPCHPQVLGLACMHAGFQILDSTDLKLLATYNQHTSLAYGLDFKVSSEEIKAASCSFYDHLLKVWTLKK